MIDAKNISKSFGDQQILKDISLHFEDGKTNLIIGQSGSGKTVLMKCLVGLYDVDKGDIEYDGRCYSKLSFKKKKKISSVRSGKFTITNPGKSRSNGKNSAN